MRDTAVRSERSEKRITRKNLVSSLLIGFGIGILAGGPLGWFSHRIYAQQRTAQVLLCRQQSFGVSEAELQSRCGSVY